MSEARVGQALGRRSKTVLSAVAAAIKCGTAVPPGGCTKETGQTPISGGGPD